MPATPNGCRHCGDEEHHHGSQYHSTVGIHTYTPPTDAQRLARMITRQAAKEIR